MPPGAGFPRLPGLRHRLLSRKIHTDKLAGPKKQ